MAFFEAFDINYKICVECVCAVGSEDMRRVSIEIEGEQL